MAQVDPRRQPIRLTPMVFTSAAVLTVALLMVRVFQPLPGVLPALDPAAAIALETRAFAEAAMRPGFGAPTDTPVSIRSGETLTDALVRVGIDRSEATVAVALLSRSFDPRSLRAGQSLEAAIAHPVSGEGPAQLLGITLRTGPAKQIALTTSSNGEMRMRALEEPVRDERRVAIGTIDGSLYTSANALGATNKLTNQVVTLFQHKIDFQRDIRAGDTFKLIFDRKVTESGRTVEAGNLLYAEIETKGGVNRFYSFQPSNSRSVEFFDENGKSVKGFLMATPISGARTSSGYGMRRHPILGFARMHTGIDFAAPTGTPILAAGDGVVIDAKWWGGYGRWVRVRHTNGWETGYAHMSSIAVKPGQRVRQGEVIGRVGSTGRSTGPHLHFEVWKGGKPVNPKDARVPQGYTLQGKDMIAFRARKKEVDTMIAVADVKKPAETPNQAVAMNTSPYRVENQGEAVSPATTAVRARQTAAARPVSTTRGMQ